MFDFDETLAKVHFNKRELPRYDDQVDILTKDKTLSVRVIHVVKTLIDIHKLETRTEGSAEGTQETFRTDIIHIE